MTTMVLNSTELLRHTADNWILYASETRNLNLYQFWFNGQGFYRITKNDEILHIGSNTTEMVVRFNALH